MPNLSLLAQIGRRVRGRWPTGRRGSPERPLPAGLETPRLELRPCSPAHLHELHRLWTDPEVRRFLFDDRILSLEEARTHLESSLASFAASRYGIWLVFERASGSVAGFAGLLRAASGEPRLVYGIRPALWGRGYATEAGAAVLHHALANLGLARVVADVDEPNRASVRVLQKLEMTPTGRQLVAGRPLLYFEAVAGPRA